MYTVKYSTFPEMLYNIYVHTIQWKVDIQKCNTCVHLYNRTWWVLFVLHKIHFTRIGITGQRMLPCRCTFTLGIHPAPHFYICNSNYISVFKKRIYCVMLYAIPVYKSKYSYHPRYALYEYPIYMLIVSQTPFLTYDALRCIQINKYKENNFL